MSALHPVVWCGPSIAAPGSDTVLVETEIDTFQAFDRAGDGTLEPISRKVTLQRGCEIAEKLLRGDPAALGDTRAAVMVAAALLGLAGQRPNPAQSVSLAARVTAEDLA
ncbi:MAG: hypothetical protein ACRDBL_09515 [Rhabdaerophilum sp.]